MALRTLEPAAARQEAVTDQSPDGQPSIGKANFLALFGRPRTVRNRNFLDLLSQTAEFRGYLGTKLEAPALES